MNLKHALAAAFLSTFALGAVAQGTTPPTDGPPKGAASGNKVADKGDGKNVADKDDGKKKVEDKDGDKDDKGDPKKASYYVLQVASDNPEKWTENKEAKRLAIAAPSAKK